MRLWARPIRWWHVLLAWLVVYLPWLPGFPLRDWLPTTSQSIVIDANAALEYALVAFSLVLLTGWVGQISLGQAAFVGVGAFTTSLLVRHAGLPFPVNLPLAAGAAAAAAALLGLVALRVRGLYLAVATLIFAWICDSYLFSASWFVGTGGGTSIRPQVIGQTGTFTVFDLSDLRVLYLVLLAATGLVWLVLVNLRDSKTGRAFFAVRGSETAAVSLGIDVTRYKLAAFALSGGLAGVAGNLIMTASRAATPETFQFTVSLFYLSIAVVGGITRPGGAVAAGVLFSALQALFVKFPSLSLWLDVITYSLLLGVLFGYPGGLAAAGSAVARHWAWLRARFYTARERRRQARAGEDLTLEMEPAVPRPAPPARSDRLGWQTLGRRRVERHVNPLVDRVRFRGLDLPVASPAEAGAVVGPAGASLPPAPPAETLTEVAGPEKLPGPAGVREWRTAKIGPYPLAVDRAERAAMLEAQGIVVRFGGLTAVDSVSLSVREHEIVGLIGPNGAGKTTMFNAIAGLNRPKAGTVRIFGQDATRLPVHLRAKMGVGRTFQLIQLFNQLSVFDNILVGTHLNNPTGMLSHAVSTQPAVQAEREAQDQVRFVISMLGLQEIADRPVAGLPFGVLRQVEIARTLVTGAPLLMLDEPASGLDNAETDELAKLLRFLRAEMGVTVLLIEHDVRMVVSVCDYMYVMNQGRPLAEGTPTEVQANPEVQAAYLGRTEDEVEPVGTAT